MTYLVAALTYTWWRGDDLPLLTPLPDLRCARTDDVPLLAELHKLGPDVIEERLATENRAYVAYFGGRAAAYGWSAARRVGVGKIDWPLSPPDRGLWDFATLAAWRGRGIYPRLLQAILRAEETEAERFWIGHRADNEASRGGIVKAGFQQVNIVVLAPERQLRLAPRGNRERALADPQGRHFGFVDAADSELALFDFAGISGEPDWNAG